MESEIETLLSDLLEKAISVKQFYRPYYDLGGMPLHNPVHDHWIEMGLDLPSIFMKQNIPVTPVPCTFVASPNRDDWDYAISIIEA